MANASQLPAPVAEHTPAAPGSDGSSIEARPGGGRRAGPQGAWTTRCGFPVRSQGGPTAALRYTPISCSTAPSPVSSRSARMAGASSMRPSPITSSCAPCTARTRRSPAIPPSSSATAAFIRRYGLGLIRPRTPSLRRYVTKAGICIAGPSIAELAERAGIRSDALGATVERYNGFATNRDRRRFRQGREHLRPQQWGSGVSPNPCIGPIATPPFYALPSSRRRWPPAGDCGRIPRARARRGRRADPRALCVRQ
jgi:3-oxosteroid 1-dehydrogenase